MWTLLLLYEVRSNSLTLVLFSQLPVRAFLLARLPPLRQDITDTINFLDVRCNFIARCLLEKIPKPDIVVCIWKQSKVFYFGSSCIFYLLSSFPLWEEAKESKNTFTLVSVDCRVCLEGKLKKTESKKDSSFLLSNSFCISF